MDLKFDVYFMNEKTGEIEIRDSRVVQKVALTNDYTKFPFLNMQTFDVIAHYLSERVFPPERDGLEELLDNLGLTEYNTYEILKRTHGIDFDDFIWFKFDENDTVKFEDIHPRGKECMLDV